MPKYTANEPKAGAQHVLPGIYDVEIARAVEKTSKSGNEMIVLTCNIKLPNGSTGPEVSEFLVFTAKSGWKIDQVRAACGQAVVPGEIVIVEASDFDGAKAVVEIGDQPGSSNPDVMFNTIERWLLPTEAAKAQKGPYGPDASVEIPF